VAGTAVLCSPLLLPRRRDLAGPGDSAAQEPRARRAAAVS
jgi:hypothetical protein